MGFWRRAVTRMWPFVSRNRFNKLSTFCDELDGLLSGLRGRMQELSDKHLALVSQHQKAVIDLGTARRDTDEARRLAASFQRQFHMLVHPEHDRRGHARFWYELQERCIEKVPEPRVYVMEPNVRVDGPNATFTNRRYDLVRFVAEMSMTLNDSCPPELVARNLADQIETAILIHWQHQSALISKPN